MNEQQLWVINNKLTENQRRYVLPRFEKRKKDVFAAYCMLFCLFTHYIYLGKPVRTLVILISFPFLVGLVWAVVDLFRIPGMVAEYNDRLLTELIQESKIVMD